MKTERSRFYLVLTVLMLVMVLIAFGRTFFLRPFFEQPPRWQIDSLPWLYVVHGTIMTAWFVLLVVQSALINVRRHQIHRKLGFAMAGLAILVVVTGILAVLDSTPRSIRMGLLDPNDPEALRGTSLFIFHDTLAVVVFTLAISVALIFRTNRLLHRTMILIGSLAFMGATGGRIVQLIPGLSFPQVLIFTISFLMAGPIALLVHDWITLKRFPKYAFAGSCLVMVMIALIMTLPGTEVGYAFFLNYLSGL